MTDTRMADLLDRLAATTPEPSEDLADAVLRSVQPDRRMSINPRNLLPALVAAATVVALLLAVGVVALTGRAKEPSAPAAPPSPPAAEAALAAGKEFAQLYMSPDYRSIDVYNRRVLDSSTGMLRADFMRGQEAGTVAARRYRNVSRTNVLTVAARDVTTTTATVLVVADQRVDNTLPIGRIDLLRRGVTERLRLVNGRWLVEEFDDTELVTDGCVDVAPVKDSDELLRQSCSAVERLYSFDYRTPVEDFSAQRAVVTDPALVADHPRSGPDERRDHVSVTTKVTNAAIERRTTTTATVLAYLEERVTNDSTSTSRLDRIRLEVDMTEIDGRWLVSGVRAL